MNIRAIAFTAKGQAWESRLGFPVERAPSVMQWTAEVFPACDAIFFIGALGIAVRAIAPHVKSKTSDPAVIVMDELGKHIIPILSGHIGGANALAHALAARTGAQAVITTATDLNHLPAIDLWAIENNCAIENPGAIKSVSGAALAGENVGVMITERKIAPPFPVTLILRPRTLYLGAGCKRGVSPEAFEAAVFFFLQKCAVSPLSLAALASVDRKIDEPALCLFAKKYGLPFLTYSPARLRAVEGVFADAEYVQSVVGVGNVCERAAVCACGAGLLVGKTRFAGITLALAGERNL